MKNPIIAELRRIRDDHASAHKFDLESIGKDLAELEPWMQKKAYTLRDGRMAKVGTRASRHKGGFKK